MTAVARADIYSTGRSSEQLLRFNPQYPIQVIIVESLFEERNFLRRTMIGLARALGNREIGAVIGDLPGCGESLLGLDEVTIEDWREAIFRLGKDLTKDYGSPPHVASIRGGALIDHAATASSWWRFACASGQDLLRPLLRTQRISGAGNGNLFAGYPTSSRLIKELETATPEDVAGPFRECSVPVIGTPLWRRAEPDEDAALTGALADDLAQWIRTCAAA